MGTFRRAAQPAILMAMQLARAPRPSVPGVGAGFLAARLGGHVRLELPGSILDDAAQSVLDAGGSDAREVSPIALQGQELDVALGNLPDLSRRGHLEISVQAVSAGQKIAEARERPGLWLGNVLGDPE